MYNTNMRLFIAINFNKDTHSQLLALQDELRSMSERGRFCMPENLHLTLVFLGECNAGQANYVKTIMDAVSFEPFDLIIDCIGRFKRNGNDLWWAGVKESTALSHLQRCLTDKLIAAGFALEKRKYTPHITLGREIVTDAVPKQIDSFGEMVSKIDLMKSERVNDKLVYTVIHTKVIIK